MWPNKLPHLRKMEFQYTLDSLICKLTRSIETYMVNAAGTTSSQGFTGQTLCM